MSHNAQRNPNVVESAVRGLTAALEAMPTVADLERALASPLQELEDIATWDLRFVLQIDGAGDSWLELFGAMVGEPRGGRTDQDYRRAITARVQINASQGEHERLILIARLLTDASVIQMTSAYPAAYTMLIATPDMIDADELTRVRLLLEEATAAGVGAHLVHAVGPITDVFRFDLSPMPAFGDAGDGMPKQF